MSTIKTTLSCGKEIDVPVTKVQTLVIGSGAAGLNAAVQLHASGIEDLAIVSEGLQMGTSINTGSDKQTYYKLGMYGEDPDSPARLAESFFSGGSMHGDLALVEAALSPRAFLNLVNLGVPFPQDMFGQFVGYKTDHDPLQRATSVGPYTSRDMCRALIKESERRGIKIYEECNVVSLITVEEDGERRAAGAIVMDSNKSSVEDSISAFASENVVFAVGGPGGIYKTSVYPNVHTGAIGLALMEGAMAQSLPESQYGMASIKFRWNVSGTYMQVVPKFVSTEADGESDPQEFLRPYFKSVGEMNSAIFLKGYQWPFDPRKVAGGSSIIDILVYIETVIKGRRVYMDFRYNCEGFDFESLDSEAYDYLKNSEALFGNPIERLRKMNPDAIRLYEDHGIHIVVEPLEIAVCAQHNNGGLAANHWWESLNIKHLFPLGEVNGTHGVYRPGGSALNSGQVAGFRAADFISHVYTGDTLDMDKFSSEVNARISDILDVISNGKGSSNTWQEARSELQDRMTASGAHIRASEQLKEAVVEAWKQVNRLNDEGTKNETVSDAVEVLRNRQLCYAHAVYLEAIYYAVKSGVGSRGSALVKDTDGIPAHDMLGDQWKFAQENPDFRDKVLETSLVDGKVVNDWIPRRPMPESTAWFETAWAEYREGKIFQ